MRDESVRSDTGRDRDRVPWVQTMLDELADGAWHNRDDIAFLMEKAVPRAVAGRAYFKLQTRINRQKGQPPPEDRDLDEWEQHRGARDIIAAALSSNRNRGTIEQRGEGRDKEIRLVSAVPPPPMLRIVRPGDEPQASAPVGELNEGSTLREVRAWHEANPNKPCPCCGGAHVSGPPRKPRAQTLSRPMVRGLVRMAEVHPDGSWFDLRALVGSTPGRPETQAKHWGLIEAERDVKPDGRLGWWRVTPKGLDFAAGRINVPRRVYVANDRVVREGGDRVYALDVLGGS